MYFENTFPPEYEVVSSKDLVNSPVYVHPKDLKIVPKPGAPINGDDFTRFVRRVSEEIAERLDLKKV